MDAGRVAPAHFEAIDCGECLLGDEVGRDRRRVGVTARERVHFAGGAESIVTDRPQDVGELEELGVGRFECVGGQLAGVRVEFGLACGPELLEAAHASGEGGDELRLAGEGEDTRQAAERHVDPASRLCDRSDCGNRLDCGVEPAEQILSTRGRPRGRAAEDADDAAHGLPRYRAHPAGRRAGLPAGVRRQVVAMASSTLRRAARRAGKDAASSPANVATTA